MQQLRVHWESRHNGEELPEISVELPPLIQRANLRLVIVELAVGDCSDFGNMGKIAPLGRSFRLDFATFAPLRPGFHGRQCDLSPLTKVRTVTAVAPICVLAL